MTCYCSNAGSSTSIHFSRPQDASVIQRRDFNQVKDNDYRLPWANIFPLLRPCLRVSWDISSTKPLGWGRDTRLESAVMG